MLHKVYSGIRVSAEEWTGSHFPRRRTGINVSLVVEQLKYTDQWLGLGAGINVCLVVNQQLGLGLGLGARA